MNENVIFEFIFNYAKNNNYKKIVEIGVGFNINIAKKLHEFFDVCVVDINRNAIENAKKEGLNGFVDNVFSPNLSIYTNTDLIYSIRPPRDLQLFILDIAKKINADLIIRPLSNEFPVDLKLKNYNGEIFYVLK
ncbi:UPF0146 family protein [Methanotorris igneus]|uniref:UPF0146 protein Metig_1004 n=1 Tax=Methanotorris igneus (strain DSM 5666 / JCM 11834 / Kol 5) TaxID=880724 RepID=F6BDI5_METIK|nr:UPF0146 family protein [Methanotorris igneus]AEF96546.1 protein of unknown function UPF0146 [Methanotorris igneus Kol 5]